jgi:pentatricopeptide repeat protein
MSQNIKCLDLKEEETLLNVLSKRKDAERTYMLYRLMLITGFKNRRSSSAQC